VSKMSRFHVHCISFLTISMGLGLFSGCALAPSRRLPREVPFTHATAFMPRAPLAGQTAGGGKEIPSLDGRMLDLAQCIKIALTQNPETRASWQRSYSAAAGVGEARSAYLPSTDFTAGANRSDPVVFDRPQATGPADTFTAGFGVRYLLFDGGARAAGLEGAAAELLNANFQHNATLQDVALKVEEAYYRLLAARELERVAQQTVRQTQTHMDVARARYANGLVARSDVLKVETEKADADLLLVRAHSQVRIVRGQLANAMGLKPSQSFEVAELPKNPRQRELADIRKLMAKAAVRRPELQAALARVESKAAKVNAAKARYWPKLTFNADYGLRDRSFVPDRGEWSLGVGLAFPFFDGFNREYSIHRAKADLAGTAAAYDKLLQGVELEVWTAYAQLIEAGKAIEAARALVASAEESVRVTEGEYKNGTASIIELTDTQTARTSANVRLVQARLDWYTAVARLERAVGRTFVQAAADTINGENNP